jgi:hypothetical protein
MQFCPTCASTPTSYGKAANGGEGTGSIDSDSLSDASNGDDRDGLSEGTESDGDSDVVDRVEIKRRGQVGVGALGPVSRSNDCGRM